MADLEGRTEVSDEDRLAALSQLQSQGKKASTRLDQIPDEGVSISLANEVAVSRGHKVETLQPDDDEAENIGENLVEKGMTGPLKDSPTVGK